MYQTWFFFLINLLIVSCASKTFEPSICQMQSPINIVPSSTVGAPHTIKAHYRTAKETIFNTGHTVKATLEGDNTIMFDGTTYHLDQFHFHTPSEHLINGEPFAAEVHLVHTGLNNKAGSPEYLVVGILYEEAGEDSVLNAILSSIPKKEHTASEPLQTSVSTLLPPELHHYYHYQGSLTTPPFTESVNWIVLQKTRTLSNQQLQTLISLEGHNARPARARQDREIESGN